MTTSILILFFNPKISGEKPTAKNLHKRCLTLISNFYDSNSKSRIFLLNGPKCGPLPTPLQPFAGGPSLLTGGPAGP